jgi:nitroimidazol reductase NimA-like FMN-containing flavoprotein (pyridoxamine 5'-phosphate oxidase superfamily)
MGMAALEECEAVVLAAVVAVLALCEADPVLVPVVVEPEPVEVFV